MNFGQASILARGYCHGSTLFATTTSVGKRKAQGDCELIEQIGAELVS